MIPWRRRGERIVASVPDVAHAVEIKREDVRPGSFDEPDLVNALDAVSQRVSRWSGDDRI
jgi:hypothetical protein